MIDPNVSICYWCTRVRNGWELPCWWNWNHRLTCPECKDRFDQMTGQEMDDLLKSQAVAEALTYEADDIETTLRKLKKTWREEL